MKQA
jgi:hypothetical protein